MIERLTDRERQILELAARHLTSKQIGPRLGIRPASVDTFMQTIIRKLGVAGRKEAVIAYMAARGGGASDRDDLDFGSSSVVDPQTSPPSGGVARPGDPNLLAASQKASNPAQAKTGSAHFERPWSDVRRLAGWGLGSPARRLVAIAIAAMTLGLVTLGVAAVGFGLNQAFDRMLRTKASTQLAGQAKVRAPIMQNLTAARIAKQLFTAEDALDHTLGETARLITSLCEARIAHRLPAIAGQRVIADAAQALAALERARRNVLGAHEGLAVLRDEYGLETLAAGVLHKPEGLKPSGELEAAA